MHGSGTAAPLSLSDPRYAEVVSDLANFGAGIGCAVHAGVREARGGAGRGVRGRAGSAARRSAVRPAAGAPGG